MDSLKCLDNKYQEFFFKLGINTKTGCLENNSQIKFATYPYIGSKYGQSTKILIVGLDIGSDEKPEGIQSFEERRVSIENKPILKHNTQIAGTYISILYFLRNEFNWNKYWNNIKNVCSYQKALKDKTKLPALNPLSYITFTNYYKFVNAGKIHKTGNINRKNIDKEIEDQLLIDEIKILKPRIIIFQSREFITSRYINLLKSIIRQNKDIAIWIGPHPSWHGTHVPAQYIKELKKINVSKYISK